MSCRILSIAGTDPTGGAGIHADLKSITAAGGYGMAVTTSLVAQNTQGVREIFTPPLDFLKAQLAAVFDDVEVDAVKIGMLGDAATVDVVHSWLDSHPVSHVVLDPVMVATSGDRLLDQDAEAAIRDLARKVTVVTPNIPELAVLCGCAPATSLEEAIAQATEFAKAHETSVLVKGGHLGGAWASNAIVTPEGAVTEIPVRRIETSNTHGTGCSLSSALATRLAATGDIVTAARWATEWLHSAIKHGAELNVGRGNGPVDHGWRGRYLANAAATDPWLAGQQVASSQVRSLANDDHLPLSRDNWPEALRPRVAPAGPITEKLWSLSLGVWADILELEFIQGLRDGTLPKQEFDFYLAQDAQYLKEYSRALAILAAKARTTADAVEWAESSQECTTAEAELHRTWLKDIAAQDVGEPSPITSAYTDMLKAAAAYEDYPIGAAAVLPCYWLYAEVGLYLAEVDSPTHPFHAWLEMYGSEFFVTAVEKALDRVERALAGATEEQLQTAIRAYLVACIHEREFFDQAMRFGKSL